MEMHIDVIEGFLSSIPARMSNIQTQIRNAQAARNEAQTRMDEMRNDPVVAFLQTMEPTTDLARQYKARYELYVQRFVELQSEIDQV